ncbi:MAG: aspartate aminotransferase, partial [Desulfurococcaceae archaeon]|nr:aspartate aminotransferase [Desulfurococcaceae archaeon]
FEAWPSTGAFYVFPRIGRVLDEVGISVEEFVERLLYTKYVVTLPGTVFPDKAGREFIRLSFAVDSKLIEEGVERIKSFVESLYAR